MKRTFVLMTAMPPTLGHAALIDFARRVSHHTTYVLVCTQPDEPFAHERFDAIAESAQGTFCVHLEEEMEQNAEADGFWDMWRAIPTKLGCGADSTIVSSGSSLWWLEGRRPFRGQVHALRPQA